MDPSAKTSLVLIVDHQEWTSRSIESILRPKGYAVVRAYSGQEALDLIGKISPDLILVDFSLPDIDGIDVARACLESPSVSAAAPILMMTNGGVGRAQRLEALGAGVWDILRHPLDPRELILRIGTFVRVKQTTDRLEEEGLTDPATGFYNARGLLRRAREISADATRLERSVACLAIGGDLFDEDHQAGSNAPEKLSEALRRVTRLSDTIGRLPSGEFVVVAPGADEDGALRLIERLDEFLRSGQSPMSNLLPSDPSGGGGLRAGYFAASLQEAAVPAEELLQRATRALRRAQTESDATGGFQVRSYQA